MSLSNSDKKRLLNFVADYYRIMTRGACDIGFTIELSGPDSDLLPTAHTCFNFLLLPEYEYKVKN
ncbi:hypothetical protein FG386_000331 [Cryptosporidium ryanae]|uniref:uncharacterized protein n=1 Tax=Cryptosporidium ryanae TaxID=515981 RepID=UPI00351A7A14|nr:hypothetical protein FG386_000331 [Cryptosporidium ryanae]